MLNTATVSKFAKLTVNLLLFLVFATLVSGIDINRSVSQSSVANLWIESLPRDIKDSILWQADHEEGTLNDWQASDSKYPGGGVLNTGEADVTARATTIQAHSGAYSAEATITGAIRAQNGSRAVRLMRWTDKPWDKQGQFLPKAAYFSTWMFFPQTYNPNKYSPWDPGDGGWWNVFQFKANNDDNVSQPIWGLSIHHDDKTKQMQFYLWSPVNKPNSIIQAAVVALPVGRWFHLEAYYQVDSGSGGEIVIWQDGKEILRGSRIRTAISKAKEYPVWGIGNYTDHIVGPDGDGRSTIYFDDAVISLRRVSKILPR